MTTPDDGGLLADDLAQVEQAAQRLRAVALALTAADLRAPSSLPGWTRGHLLAHVAQNGDAMSALLEAAADGRPGVAYASQQARDDAIEHGATAEPGALRDSLRAADERFARGASRLMAPTITPVRDRSHDTRVSSNQTRTGEIIGGRGLPPEVWQQQVAILTGRPFPLAELPVRRWVELELHHTDLDVGYSPAHWPGEFAARLLPEPATTLRADRVAQSAAAPPVELLLLSGSTRTGSTNAAILATVAELDQADVRPKVYDRLTDLPAFDPGADPVPAEVADLRARVGAAGAVLVCTPEYAGALPGAFKNLLDHLVGGGEAAGKPVGWLNVSSVAAPSGGRHAHDELARVLGYLGADVVPSACRVAPMSRAAVGPAGTVTDGDVRRQLALAVRALVRRARAGAPD